MHNPFWEYSCTVYANEEVAAVCLELQDAFNLDVNILLYALWLASQELVLELDHLQRLDAQVAPWRQEVVQPLRELRREAGELPQLEESYVQMKSLELDAERQQQDTMYQFFGALELAPSGTAPLRDNLLLVASCLSRPSAGWNECIERLSHLLDAASAGVAPRQDG